jgi:iron complex transport system ATP-binding protein
MRPAALAQRMAYVPQRSIVSAAFTVRQVVELGRYALPPDSMKVSQAIESLDLVDVEHRPYRDLSVGQQQRVTLARALAQLEAGGVLVLDEPTSAMDLQHIATAHRLFRNSATGPCKATVIVAMHDLPLAATLTDHAWLLQRGRLVAAGPTCDVLSVERLEQVFGVGFAWITDDQGRPRLLPDLPVAAHPG